MTGLLFPFVLLVNGLAAGVQVGTQLGGWPLLAALPSDRYVAAHAFFSTRYDPFMPACLLSTVAGDVALAVLSAPVPVRTLTTAAAVAAAGSIAVSLLKNVPVNKWLRTLDPDDLPPDFADRDPRPRWGAWNRIRTGLTVLALFANCAAVGLEL